MDTHSLLGRDESSLRRKEFLPWRKKASMELRTVMRSTPSTGAAKQLLFSCWLFSSHKQNKPWKYSYWWYKGDVSLFIYSFSPQLTHSPVLCTSSSSGTDLGTQRLQEPALLLFPPQGQVCSLPCGVHPLTSTELFTKDFPPSYSWSGLASSAEEIWKGNLKRILLEVAVLPIGFGCWRADQHKHVILCYIKSNIPCYSVSTQPRVSPFCIIESVLYLWRCPYFLSRPLLKLSVLQSLLMKQTIPTPKGQKRRTWCSSAECCLFGLIRIVLKWLTPNSSCAQNCVSP